MTSLLVKNASILVTIDPNGTEIEDGGLFIEDGVIRKVAKTDDLPEQADQVLDLRGHILMPGLVNTHHHFYQTLTRCIPNAQNTNLFHWLKTLYPIWSRMLPDDIFISTQVALAELAQTGCTTASDHLYIYPNGATLEDEIFAAREIGLRLHASRGSMSIGESQGGLPPDSIVENETMILRECQRLIEKYHLPGFDSKLQIVLAPCSPFSVSQNLMKLTIQLAREYGVQVHTHLAETLDEEAYCQQHFGYRPVDYMKTLGWLGKDVWFAHSVYVNSDEINTYAKFGCGVAHCPSSNMRLASGIAPIQEMLLAGVKIGLGVDGSASNDGSHMLAEARQALLLSRLQSALSGASLSSNKHIRLMSAREILRIATLGGASVLGRTDIGSLEVGKCADFIAFNANQLEYSGAQEDLVAALVFCSPVKVSYSYVSGKPVVFDNELVTCDLPVLVEKHQKASRRIIRGD
jgi:cytosine/adenosine deaminase-related metal-dependent hydrolase